MEIANLARDHEVGDPIPRIDYTPEERQTWATVLQELTRLYPTHGEALPGLGQVQCSGLQGWQEHPVPVLGDIRVLTSWFLVMQCTPQVRQNWATVLSEGAHTWGPAGVAPACILPGPGWHRLWSSRLACTLQNCGGAKS